MRFLLILALLLVARGGQHAGATNNKLTPSSMTIIGDTSDNADDDGNNGIYEHDEHDHEIKQLHQIHYDETANIGHRLPMSVCDPNFLEIYQEMPSVLFGLTTARKWPHQPSTFIDEHASNVDAIDYYPLENDDDSDDIAYDRKAVEQLGSALTQQINVKEFKFNHSAASTTTTTSRKANIDSDNCETDFEREFNRDRPASLLSSSAVKSIDQHKSSNKESGKKTRANHHRHHHGLTFAKPTPRIKWLAKRRTPLTPSRGLFRSFASVTWAVVKPLLSSSSSSTSGSTGSNWERLKQEGRRRFVTLAKYSPRRTRKGKGVKPIAPDSSIQDVAYDAIQASGSDLFMSVLMMPLSIMTSIERQRKQQMLDELTRKVDAASTLNTRIGEMLAIIPSDDDDDDGSNDDDDSITNAFNETLTQMQNVKKKLEFTLDYFDSLKVGSMAALMEEAEQLVNSIGEIIVSSSSKRKRDPKVISVSNSRLGEQIGAIKRHIEHIEQNWTAIAFDRFEGLGRVMATKPSELESSTSAIVRSLGANAAVDSAIQRKQLEFANDTLVRMFGKLDDLERRRDPAWKSVNEIESVLWNATWLLVEQYAPIERRLRDLPNAQTLVDFVDSHYNKALKRIQALRELLAKLPTIDGGKKLKIDKQSIDWAKTVIYGGDASGASIDELLFDLDTMVMGRSSGLQRRSMFDWYFEHVNALIENEQATGVSPRWYMEVVAEQVVVAQLRAYTLAILAHQVLLEAKFIATTSHSQTEADTHKQWLGKMDLTRRHAKLSAGKCAEMEAMIRRQDPVIGFYRAAASPLMRLPRTVVEPNGTLRDTFVTSMLTQISEMEIAYVDKFRFADDANKDTVMMFSPMVPFGCHFMNGFDSQGTTLLTQCKFRRFVKGWTASSSSKSVFLKPEKRIDLRLLEKRKVEVPNPNRIYFVPGVLSVASPDHMFVCGVIFEHASRAIDGSSKIEDDDKSSSDNKQVEVIYFKIDVCEKASGRFIGTASTLDNDGINDNEAEQQVATLVVGHHSKAAATGHQVTSLSWANYISSEWNELAGQGWITGIGLYTEESKTALPSADGEPKRILKIELTAKYH